MPIVDHSYEEIRDVVVDILTGVEPTEFRCDQFGHLVLGVQEVFARRAGDHRHRIDRPRSPNDDELVRDVFWDLFRQGAITLGLNDANRNFPHFRLSHFGQRTLASGSPYRFHDTSSYLSLLTREVPDVSREAVAYADEAVASFYAGCLLASCVMLGVAAEAEFIRLVECAASRPTQGSRFRAALDAKFIRTKITKFQNALPAVVGDLDVGATEDLDANFAGIQSVLRIARNEAGHPTAASPIRENVYIYLQLYIPFARQLMRLRHALLAHDPDAS